jgi:hypothetical protein
VSEGSYFDFNPDTSQFRGVDLHSAALLTELVSSETGSRARAIAAIAAARSLILRDLADPDNAATREAFAATAAELFRVEYALRDLEDGVPPTGLTAPRGSGRPPASNAVADFQARAVAAVAWLQRLQAGALTKQKAIAAVAEHIPTALLRAHAGRDRNATGTLTQLEQLERWIDDCGRKGTRGNGLLRELWYELTVERDIPLETQSPDQVLAWLDAERQRLLNA